MYASDHIETDPACRLYTPPSTWWQRRRHNKARGRLCSRCALHRAWVGRNNDRAILNEVFRNEAVKQVQELTDMYMAGLPASPTIRQAWVSKGYLTALDHVTRDLSLFDMSIPTAGPRSSSPSEREQL